MADLSLPDYGTIQVPNALDQMTKLYQVQKYSLDYAKEAREFNAFKTHGAAAATGDPGAMEKLASEAPNYANLLGNLRHTTAASLQQEQSTRSEGLRQAAVVMYSLRNDPARQMAYGMNEISRMERENKLHPTSAQQLRDNLITNPHALDGFIEQNLPPQHLPGVQAKTKEYEAYIESKKRQVEESMKPKILEWEQMPDGSFRQKGYRPPDLPGAISPEQMFNPSAPMFQGPAGRGAPAPAPAPGGVPSRRSSLMPEEAPPSGTPAARRTLASYAPTNERDVGAEGEYGVGSPTLPQRAYTSRLFGQESGNRDVPNAMGSSASGLGQFINETWDAQMRKLIPDQVAGMNDAQIRALKSDPRLQHAATMSLADDNAPQLARAGVPVNAATLAMSHKIGAGGVIKAFNSDPNSSMAAVLRAGPSGEQAVSQNPSWARQSVSGFVRSHYNAFGNKPVAGIAGVPRTGTTFGAEPPASAAAPATAPPASVAAPATAPEAPAAPEVAAAAPAATAAAWTPGRPNTGSFTYGGGDSIGLGFIKAGGVPGTTAASTTVKGSEGADGVGSRNPQQALTFIKAHPDRFEGQDVIWSTGLSNSGGVKNAEKNISLVGEQIDAMKEAKANNIVIAGVGQGSVYGPLNERLDALAKEKGVHFGGALPTSKIHLEPGGYKDYVQNATRLLEAKRAEAATGDSEIDELVQSGREPSGGLQYVPAAATSPTPGRIIEEAPAVTDTGSPHESARTLAADYRNPILPKLPPGQGSWQPLPEEIERQKREITEPMDIAQQTKQTEVDRIKNDVAYDHAVKMLNVKEREEGMRQAVAGAQAGAKEVEQQFLGADRGEQNLPLIERALDRFRTGSTGNWRKATYDLITDVSGALGIESTHAQRESAAAALIKTSGSLLGFDLVNALGAREAVQVVQQVMGIKPSLINSPGANKIIIEAIRQDFQRKRDMHSFYDEWFQGNVRNEKGEPMNRNPGTYIGAATAFAKLHPVAAYASKIVPLPLPMTDDNKNYDRSKLVPGVIYHVGKDKHGAGLTKDGKEYPEGTQFKWTADKKWEPAGMAKVYQ